MGDDCITVLNYMSADVNLFEWFLKSSTTKALFSVLPSEKKESFLEKAREIGNNSSDNPRLIESVLNEDPYNGRTPDNYKELFAAVCSGDIDFIRSFRSPIA